MHLGLVPYSKGKRSLRAKYASNIIEGRSSVVVLAFKTVGAMLQSPCGLLGCPSLLDPPSTYKTFQGENFTTHNQLQCKQISDTQAFRSTQQSKIIHSDSFLLRHAKQGAQSQKLGVHCTPAPNVEPPISLIFVS